MTSSPMPMTRLFDGHDIAFLRSLPHFDEGVEKAFRRRRCRIFRGYLLSVRAEFLEALGEVEAAGAATHRPAHTLTLLHYRLQFAAALVPAYARLLRYRFGWGGVDLQDVVRRFESVCTGLRRLASDVPGGVSPRWPGRRNEDNTPLLPSWL